MKRAPAMVVIGLAGALLSGCGVPPKQGADGGGAGGGGTAELALGTAQTDGTGFVEMPVAAVLTPGAQGGFHVWLSYRVRGTSGAVKAAHTVRRESDGKLLSRGERRLEVGGVGEGGWWQSDTATPAFLCPTPLGVSVIDEHAVFEVRLLAEDGSELATQQVKTQLVCPADGQAAFCMNICKG